MSITRTARRMALVAGGVFAALPTVALAEEERSGIALLIPSLAEFIPACIAFIIILIIFSKLLWPTVLGMMDAREKAIQDDLDAAAAERAKAEESAIKAEKAVADAQRQAQDIVSEAHREAEAERSQVLAKAQKDAAATIAKGKEAVEAERARAVSELSASVVDLSVDIAGKIVGQDLTDEEHLQLAGKYLLEVVADDESK